MNRRPRPSVGLALLDAGYVLLAAALFRALACPVLADYQIAIQSYDLSDYVDLPGERLTAVAVVSTGIPTPDAENAAQRRYYDQLGEDGWFLTMVLPGITRVIQAAGRLIRTGEDRGRLLLVDARYEQPQTRRLLEGTLIGDALRRNGKDTE